MQEITAPLSTLPHDPVAAVHADFPVALRGYDRIAVDAYVQQTSQLVAELQATRSPEAAVRKALERVGEQISGILQRAHETAAEITTQSRRDAEDRLEHARIEAAEIVAGAYQRIKDLDADTDRIWIERHRIVDDARELSAQLAALASSAAERFPPAEPEAVPEEPLEGEAEPLVAADEPYDEFDEPGAEDATTPYDDSEDPTQIVPPDDVEATRPFGERDVQDERRQPSSGESGAAPKPPADGSEHQ